MTTGDDNTGASAGVVFKGTQVAFDERLRENAYKARPESIAFAAVENLWPSA